MIIALRGAPWIYGLDAVIQFIGFLVALFVSLYGYRAYKITNKNKYLFFSLAFFLLSIGLLIFTLSIPVLHYYYQTRAIQIIHLFYKVAYGLNFIYMFTILMAYSLFIVIYSKIERRVVIALLGILNFALAFYSFLSRSFTGFNLIAVALLIFVIYYTGKNYITRRSFNSLLVLLTFILIAIAHLLFPFGEKNNLYYLLAHSAQLIGYFSLFIMFLRVHYGKKK